MHNVLILGGTTFDHIVTLPHLPDPLPQTIHTAPFKEAIGSTGAGKVLNLSKLKIPTTLYSVLGNDFYGQKIIDYLQQENIDFIYDFDPLGTERHINIMDKNGARISMFISQSDEMVKIDFEKLALPLKNATVIVLNIISYCKQLIPLLQNINKPIWTDLHDYDGINNYHEPFINAAKFIHLSSDNLINYRQTMTELIAKGKALVICTHAEKGATLLTKDGLWLEQPAIPINYITDANGAGDSFFSGFLYGYLNNKTLKQCLKMGALTAYLCLKSNHLFSEDLNMAYLENNV